MSLFIRNSSRFLLQKTQKRQTHVSSCGDVFRPAKSCSSSKTDYRASTTDALSSRLPETSVRPRKTHVGKKNNQLGNPCTPTPLELVLRLKHGSLPNWVAQPMFGSPHQLPSALWLTSRDKNVHKKATHEQSSHQTPCDIDSSARSSTCTTSDDFYSSIVSRNINFTPQRSQSLSNVSAAESIGSKMHIVQCSKLDMDETLKCDGSGGVKDDDSSPQSHLPTLQQLKDVEFYVQDKIPMFFRETHQYSIYVVDIEFHNNIAQKPYKTKGLLPYVWALTKLRMFAHINYVRVDMKVLKTTIDEDLGIVQVRWQVIGMPQSMAIKFWKVLKDKNELVIDGFSTLTVNKDGKIYKHVADNVMPDQERKRRRMSYVERLREKWRLRPDAGLSATAKK